MQGKVGNGEGEGKDGGEEVNGKGGEEGKGQV